MIEEVTFSGNVYKVDIGDEPEERSSKISSFLDFVSSQPPEPNNEPEVPVSTDTGVTSEQFTQPTVQGGQVTFEGQGQSPVKSAEVEVKPTVLTALNATGSLMPTADKDFAMPGMQNGAATFGGQQSIGTDVVKQPEDMMPSERSFWEGEPDPILDPFKTEVTDEQIDTGGVEGLPVDQDPNAMSFSMGNRTDEEIVQSRKEQAKNSRPKIGALEFNNAVVAQRGGDPNSWGDFVASQFDPAVMMPTLMSVFGNEQDQMDLTEKFLPGTIKKTDEFGNKYIEVGGKEFRSEDVLPFLGDASIFSPQGFISKPRAALSAFRGFMPVLKESLKRMGFGAVSSGTKSVAAESGRALVGAEFDPVQVGIETGAGLAGEAVEPIFKAGVGTSKWLAKTGFKFIDAATNNAVTDGARSINSLTGGIPKKIVRKILGPKPKLTQQDVNMMNKIIVDGDQALQNALDNINLRNQVATKTGTKQVPLSIAQATEDPFLLERQNMVASMQTAHGQNIGRKIAENDSQLKDVMDAYIQRSYTPVHNEFPQGQIIEAALKTKMVYEQSMRPHVNKLFSEMKSKNIQADLTDVVKELNEIKLDELKGLIGKGSFLEGRINKFIKLLKPIKESSKKGGKKIKLLDEQGMPISVSNKAETILYTDPKELHNIYKEAGDLIRQVNLKLGKGSNSGRVLGRLAGVFKRSVDDAMEKLGPANKAWIDMTQKLEKMDAGIIGQLTSIDPNKRKEVSALLFNPEYAGSPTLSPEFKLSLDYLEAQNPDAVRDLTATELNKIFTTKIDPKDNIGGNMANELRKKFNPSQPQLRLLKTALSSKADRAKGVFSENAKLLDDMSDLFGIFTPGRQGGSRTTPSGLINEQGVVGATGKLSMLLKPLDVFRKFLQNRDTNLYMESIGRVLSSPESIWFPELKASVNMMKAAKTEKKMEAAFTRLFQMLDDRVVTQEDYKPTGKE